MKHNQRVHPRHCIVKHDAESIFLPIEESGWPHFHDVEEAREDECGDDAEEQLPPFLPDERYAGDEHAEDFVNHDFILISRFRPVAPVRSRTDALLGVWHTPYTEYPNDEYDEAIVVRFGEDSILGQPVTDPDREPAKG